MGTRILHLVRHGHFIRDKKDLKHGHLTPLGLYQAAKLSKRLGETDFDIAYVSTTTRTRETADIILNSISVPKVSRSNLLVEGLPYFPTSKAKKMNLKEGYVTKSTQRLERAFAKHFRPLKGNKTRNELLVCHGNVIRFFTAKALGMSPKNWTNFDILQCSLTRIAIEDDGSFKILSFAEIGHIPIKKRTFL